jgi:ribokinase
MRLFILGSYVNANCLCVERLPQRGESLVADALIVEHGGKGLNVAVGLHRLGAQVDTLLAVGHDAAAEALLQFLQQAGMATQWVSKAGPHSGFGVGFIADNGDNFLAVHPGANALMDSALVMRALDDLRAADLVYAQFEIPDAPILTAFRLARRQGIRTFLNPSPWRLISQELLALTNILVLNAPEAALLFEMAGSEPVSASEWLTALPDGAKRCHWQGDVLLVTLAEQGCVALAQGKTIYTPGLTVTAVDATGAGDAFNAGLAIALAEQKPLADALTFANACGAWVAARAGVLQALPTRAEIALWLANAPPTVGNTHR